MKRGQRKALPHDEIGECVNLLEKAKASIRAKVEHPFHVIKNLFKHGKARYRGLAKNEVQLFSWRTWCWPVDKGCRLTPKVRPEGPKTVEKMFKRHLAGGEVGVFLNVSM
ncbi:transposase, IS5 family [Pseudomonas agarici]|nr:transposase, IS5 family [Pseudomonas agarici]